MVVHKKMPLRALPRDSIEVLNQRLVAPLHEVHFDAFDAPLLVLIERRNQLIAEGLPDHPENDAHVSLLAVFDDFRNVDLRHDVQDIA